MDDPYAIWGICSSIRGLRVVFTCQLHLIILRWDLFFLYVLIFFISRTSVAVAQLIICVHVCIL
jgi:hypothetical protein